MSTLAPVLIPLTSEAQEAIQGDSIKLNKFPFLIGRESRVITAVGSVRYIERRKKAASPSNDLYIRDKGKNLNISREHLQIEKKEDGTYDIVDRGSTCGTIVDNRVVGGRDKGGHCPLIDGSVIVIGSSKSPFIFKFLVPPQQIDTDGFNSFNSK